jgi:hypothetical protein
MNVAMVPPGAVAYAHVHVGFEVMLYILQGRVRHEYGDKLRQSIENAAGDFIYIEPGVPHGSSTSAIRSRRCRRGAIRCGRVGTYRAYDRRRVARGVWAGRPAADAMKSITMMLFMLRWMLAARTS